MRLLKFGMTGLLLLIWASNCYAIDSADLDTVYNHYTNTFDFVWSETALDSNYWRLDMTNSPPTATIDIGAEDFITTGDITIDSDSSLLRLGDTPATDYTIGWDSSDAVHTVTAGDFIFTGGEIQAPFGSVTAPTFSFAFDSNTGFYNHGADQWGISAGGQVSLRGDVFGILVTDGTAGFPAYSFLNSTTTGFYRPLANTVAVSIAGTEKVRFDSVGVDVSGDILASGTITGDLITTFSAPVAPTSTGTKGSLTHDSDYIYVCIATDSWKRAELSTWSVGFVLLDDGVSFLVLDDGTSKIILS